MLCSLAESAYMRPWHCAPPAVIRHLMRYFRPLLLAALLCDSQSAAFEVKPDSIICLRADAALAECSVHEH